MKGTRAAVRYAKAFYQLAVSNNALDSAMEDIRLIKGTIKANKELMHLLKTPLVNSEKKQKVMMAIFKDHLQNLSQKLIALLIEKNREALLPFVCDSFIDEYNQAHQIGQVKVESAIPLDAEEKKNIESAMKERYALSKVELNQSVNKELIGGIILTIGDQQFDGSIKSKINQFKKELIHH